MESSPAQVACEFWHASCVIWPLITGLSSYRAIELSSYRAIELSGYQESALNALYLRSLDVHHLSILNVLLREQSVSRTAELLDQPQPAISRALRRLRETFGDAILVRCGTGMVLTDAGRAMREPVRKALANLDSLFNIDTSFVPQISDRQFFIASADCLGAVVLPFVASRILAAGPFLRMHARAVGSEFDYAGALESGELDLVFGCWTSPPENLRSSTLCTVDLVCLTRQDHPLARAPITLEQYLYARHVVPLATSPSEPGPIDLQLAHRGHRRNVAVTLPEYNMVPYMLMESDLVFTTGRPAAERMAKHFPLTLSPAPPELAPVRFYQLWHERAHDAASSRWLRALSIEAVQAVLERDGLAVS
jgi:DNA-binding transcriptional LysR family regulator